MVLTPQLLLGHVMHKRVLPKENLFTYGIYYVVIPLDQRHALPLAYNRFSALSFYDKDHAEGQDLLIWIRSILNQYGLTQADGHIDIICMPRVLGYVFNPVSFWRCFDKEGQLRVVLCEVHNTFGQCHYYVCANPDGSSISPNHILTGKKLFHVSPFLKREGHYTFQFNFEKNNVLVKIYFYNEEEKLQLLTSLSGKMTSMTRNSLIKVFFAYPLVTLKAIFLIHWQALKLMVKGIPYIKKPKQELAMKELNLGFF